jgi:hypothetical protein
MTAVSPSFDTAFAPSRAEADARHEQAVAMGDMVMLCPCGGPVGFDVTDPDVRRLALVAGVGSALLSVAGVAASLFLA